MTDKKTITGLILSGGRASRMGGVDKGLLLFNGRPLVQHALLRLQQNAGVGSIMINANRQLDAYQSFGVPVWPDELPNYAGPLAGLQVGLRHCATPWLLSVPCDAPLFPLDLASRLANALQTTGGDIAIASAPQRSSSGQMQLRAQPVFCLLRTTLLASLTKFIQAGGRKVGAWAAKQNALLVAFDQPGDDLLAFFNANTLAELQQLEHAT